MDTETKLLKIIFALAVPYMLFNYFSKSAPLTGFVHVSYGILAIIFLAFFLIQRLVIAVHRYVTIK